MDDPKLWLEDKVGNMKSKPKENEIWLANTTYSWEGCLIYITEVFSNGWAGYILDGEIDERDYLNGDYDLRWISSFEDMHLSTWYFCKENCKFVERVE